VLGHHRQGLLGDRDPLAAEVELITTGCSSRLGMAESTTTDVAVDCRGRDGDLSCCCC
jgi:hypothetical protein